MMTEQELIELEQRYLLSRSTNKRLVAVAPEKVFDAMRSLIAEIRRLNEDNDRLNFKVKTLGEKLTDLCMQIADAPRVYGHAKSKMASWSPEPDGHTHTALLIDIKKIGDNDLK